MIFHVLTSDIDALLAQEIGDDYEPWDANIYDDYGILHFIPDNAYEDQRTGDLVFPSTMCCPLPQRRKRVAEATDF